MNDYAELMKRARNQGVGCTRNYSRTDTMPHAETIDEEALDDIRTVLDCGLWFPTKEVKALAKEHGISFITLGKELKLTQSDSGKWICLPCIDAGDAPDEVIK